MREQTEVVEINDRAGSSIPLHSFEFVDFGDVPSRDKDTSLLTGGFSWELIVSLQ
jgi:replication factor A1